MLKNLLQMQYAVRLKEAGVLLHASFLASTQETIQVRSQKKTQEETAERKVSSSFLILYLSAAVF